MDTADSQAKRSRPYPDAPRHRGHWRASALALFLPGLVIAAGYGALWTGLHVIGRGDGALARVCMLVVVIIVPSLLAYAGLRLATTRLTLRGAHLEAHPGFPARDPILVSYTDVTGLTVRRGLSGWITGAGSLVIERGDAVPVVVSGLSYPSAALADLSARCEAFGKPALAA